MTRVCKGLYERSVLHARSVESEAGVAGVVGLCASRIEHLSTDAGTVRAETKMLRGLVFNALLHSLSTFLNKSPFIDMDSLSSASWLIARKCSVSLTRGPPCQPQRRPAREHPERGKPEQTDAFSRLQAEPRRLLCSGLEQSPCIEDFGAQAF